MPTLTDLACHLKFGGRNPPSGPAGRRLAPLILVTDERRLPDPVAAAAALPAGSLVILRHYDDPGRKTLARRLAVLCRARRLTLLIAGDLDLAVATGTGLHLPEGLARAASPRVRLWHRQGRHPLTVAAHGRTGLVVAGTLAADAALLSPVFPTRSHPGQPGLGLVRFRRLVREAGVDIYALGGVTAATARALRGSGIAGLAAIGGLAAGSLGGSRRR